ncbi:cold-shock protein [Microlunatus soli]|uniref:Cold shock protein (Beta-ribbon, CspA family) n=1 Tax=Microlunatus soli TaxID=630515 RepID=A0A1H1V9K8_9ACTN|nr:cold shock domain-containing protein [Microlunatus soli]SDS80949.1 cold shock protein (beta-ribbon, CspA family) [Microlunatus soli]
MKSVVGTVLNWNDEEGWGVLRSADVTSDVFAHFSELALDGYRTVQPGQAVRFGCEHVPGGQDGYDYRAVDVRVID